MGKIFGFDLSQGSTKRGLTVLVAAVASYFLVPPEHRQEAILAIIAGHGALGSFLLDSPKSQPPS
jgi:hypothetical protein